jgi:hypothetical protein
MPTNRVRKLRQQKKDVTSVIPDDVLFFLRYGWQRENPYKSLRSSLLFDLKWFGLPAENLKILTEIWQKHEQLIRQGLTEEPYILQMIDAGKRSNNAD